MNTFYDRNTDYFPAGTRYQNNIIQNAANTILFSVNSRLRDIENEPMTMLVFKYKY